MSPGDTENAYVFAGNMIKIPQQSMYDSWELHYVKKLQANISRWQNNTRSFLFFSQKNSDTNLRCT